MAPRPADVLPAITLSLAQSPPSIASFGGTLRLNMSLFVNNSDNAHYTSADDEKPLRWAYVRLYDDGTIPGVNDRFLADGYADGDGDIEFAVTNSDDDPLNPGLDPYVLVYSAARPGPEGSELKFWVHGEGSNNYTLRYDWDNNMPDGTHARDLYFDDQPAFYIFSRIGLAYIAAKTHGLFTPAPVTVRWHPGFVPPYSGYTNYEINRSVINIQDLGGDPDAWDPDVIMRVYGYHVMWGMYGNQWPSHTNLRNVHGVCTHPNAAWPFGFGVFFQAAAQNSGDYRDAPEPATSGFLLNRNLEPMWDGHEGRCYEFSIAGTLWDIYDAAADDDPDNPGQDNLNAGFDEVWDVLVNYRTTQTPNITENIDHFRAGWIARNHGNQTQLADILLEHYHTRSLVGANLMSRWLDPGFFTQPEMSAQVNVTGLQIVNFGVPVGNLANRVAITKDWLNNTAPRPAIVVLNTFAAFGFDATLAEIQGLFNEFAFLNNFSQVVAVSGANEPIRLASWNPHSPTPAEVQERIRIEHSAWHNVSSLPMCHKFTNPTAVNATPDMTWSHLQSMWNSTQDAVCYDWYPGFPNYDDEARLDDLKAEADARSFAIHVLESKIPSESSVQLAADASRIHTGRGDTWSVFHILTPCESNDPADCNVSGTRFPSYAAWWRLLNGTWVEKPTGTMLKGVLCPC